MSNSLAQRLEPLLSIKTAVFLFGKLCAVLALYAAWQFAIMLSTKPEQEDPFLDVHVDPPTNTKNSVIPPSYSEITNSNVFGTSVGNSTPTPTATPASNSTLKLIAVNEASNGVKLAIIEDSKGQTQDVFSISESVFGAGKLIEISPESVKIDRGGTIELLALAESSSTGGGGSPEANQTDFSVADEEITSALANLPQLLSQARAVPYFRNGTSIGMRLFAIKPESLYEKLGLKNGDIILSVNENSLSDPAQALKLFEQLKTERAINVKLERNSQVSEMRYSIR